MKLQNKENKVKKENKIQEILISCIFILTKIKTQDIIYIAITYGEVAQLARASGSYPAGREFKSPLRYQIKKIRYFKKKYFIFLLYIDFINFFIIISLDKQKNPRLSRKMCWIFKDLLLKTGGCLPKYSWASYIKCKHARHILRLAPLTNL